MKQLASNSTSHEWKSLIAESVSLTTVGGVITAVTKDYRLSFFLNTGYNFLKFPEVKDSLWPKEYKQDYLVLLLGWYP